VPTAQWRRMGAHHQFPAGKRPQGHTVACQSLSALPAGGAGGRAGEPCPAPKGQRAAGDLNRLAVAPRGEAPPRPVRALISLGARARPPRRHQAPTQGEAAAAGSARRHPARVMAHVCDRPCCLGPACLRARFPDSHAH